MRQKKARKTKNAKKESIKNKGRKPKKKKDKDYWLKGERLKAKGLIFINNPRKFPIRGHSITSKKDFFAFLTKLLLDKGSREKEVIYSFRK